MATILRSLRYIRSSGAFSRHVALNQRQNIICSTIRRENAVLSSSVADSKPDLQSNIKSVQTPLLIHSTIQKLQDSVQRCGRTWKKEILKVINGIESSAHLDRLHICSLIRWCGMVLEALPSERIELVQELWDTLNTYDFPLDISHYNALLHVYVTQNHTFSPTKFLTDMTNKDVKPDIITYETLIKYYCERGDIPSTTKILERVKDEELPLTENIFNSLILGHSEAGDLNSAIKTLMIMKNNNINVTVNTYTALMCAYAKVNDRETINELISTCKSRNINLTNSHIWKVIYALAKHNHLDNINSMFNVPTKTINPQFEINAIIKLMEMGHPDAALSRFVVLLKLLRNKTLFDHFIKLFVQKLIMCTADSDKIVNICSQLEKYNNGYDTLLKAVYYSYSKYDEALSLALLRCCSKAHYNIKQHYFWPLLARKGNIHDFQGILDILKCMITEFNLTPNIQTIQDYVLPHSFGKPTSVHKLLKDNQVNEVVLNNAFVSVLLKNNRTLNAVAHMKTFPSMYYYNVLQDLLRKAVCETFDVASFVQISLNLCKSNESDFSTHRDLASNPVSMVSMDEQMMDFITFCPNQKPVLFQVAEYLAKSGIHLAPETVDAINLHVQGFVTGKITNLRSAASWDQNSATLNEDPNKLLQMINDQKSNGISSRRLELGLINLVQDNTSHRRTPLSSDVYSFVISHYCKNNDLTHAEKFMNEAANFYSNFGDSALHLDYANVLLKKRNYKDAYQHLVQNSGLPSTNQTYNNSIYLLNNLATNSSVTSEQFEKMFLLLKSYGYIKLSVKNVSQFINPDTQSNLSKAVDIFCLLLKEKILSHRSKHRLCKTLINKREDELLQNLVNECSKYQQKHDVLSDLFFDFLECNRLDQAMKIFEMIKSADVASNWWNRIIKYQEQRDHINMERYLEATDTSLRIHRMSIYDNLVQIYVSNNEWQKGLNLWMKMQDENLTLSASSLNALGSLLTKNNQDVPFPYDEIKTPDTATKSNKSENILQEVKEALENNDLQKTEKLLESIPSDDDNFVTCYNLLINNYLSKNEANRIIELVSHGIRKNKLLSKTSVFGEYLQVLSRDGNTEILEKFESYSSQ